MITAAEIAETAGFIYDEVAAMGADVGEEADRFVVVDEDKGFVEVFPQENEGLGVASGRDLPGVTDELPGGGEAFFFYFLEELCIGV
jgi:hypothetical protein